MQTQQFELPIQGQRVKKNQVTSIHLMAGLLLLAMGSVTWAIPNQMKTTSLNLINYAGIFYALSGLLLIIICIFFNKTIIQNKTNFSLRILELLLFLPILIYTLIQSWYLPATYAVAAIIAILLAYFWEKRGMQTKNAIINTAGIKLPLTGKNGSLDWQEINNVILKYNILTIDCKNNRLIQLSLPTTSTPLPHAAALEKFCAEQIIAQGIQPSNNW